MRCPACGADNREGARFCDACGARMPEAAPVPAAPAPEAPSPPDSVPTVVRIDAAPPPIPAFELPPVNPGDLPPTHPEWRMSPAGPLPDPPKRRIWLWIVGGLLFCVAMFIMMNVLLAGIAPQGAGS